MKSHWLTHQGKRILFCDCTQLTQSDLEILKSELNGVEGLILLEAEQSVLMLCDIRGSIATPEALDPFKQFSTHTAKYIQKLAVLGVSGLKKVLFDALVQLSGMHATAYDEMENALDWLVE